jgi:hypothetical protein
MEVSLDVASATDIAGLQWEIEVPMQHVRVEEDGIEAGPAAVGAGKQVQCSGRWRKAPRTYSYVCLVSGAGSALASGTVAVLTLVVPEETKAGRYTFRIDRATAVTKGLKAIRLKEASGVVAVR